MSHAEALEGKHAFDHIDDMEPNYEQANVHDAAARGHLATDKFGNALVDIDTKAAAKLRLKIDLYILPIVFLLYLFCFIDRANIGQWWPCLRDPIHI